jgi:WS/DGAT/MGAT family acyltransferase
LWELWLVEGLGGGSGFAVLSKTHHALVDGISGVDIMTVLFDTSRDPVPVAQPDQEWIPRPLPSSAQLLGSALLERLTAPPELLGAAGAALHAPLRLAGHVGTALSGVCAIASVGAHAAPSSPFNVRIGPHRRFSWVQSELDDFRYIKRVLGGTVNDVVLAAVAGALGRYMRRHGFQTDGLELTALVPVSTRAEVERGALGNRVAAMWAPLPVGIDDPIARMARIANAMAGLKESGQAVGAHLLTEFAGFAPPTIVDQAARLQAHQRLFNLVVTNVPGPQAPLYLLAHELDALYPLVPLVENTTLGIAGMSYNGQLNFGLTSDYDALGDLEALADDLRDAIDELLASAGNRQTPRRRADAPGRLSEPDVVPASE